MRSLFLILCFPFILFSQKNIINHNYNWLFDSSISSIDTSFNGLSSSLLNYSQIDLTKEDLINSKSQLINHIFNKNLFHFKKEEYEIIINPVIDFSLGGRGYFSSMRGAYVQGKIGSKFNWFSLYYENFRNFVGKTNTIISNKAVAPGESEVKFGSNGIDYSVAQGGMEYSFSKYFNLSLGHGKNFIGNGYRSLLLSDVANSYPYLKTEITIGKIKYSSVVAEFIDFTNNLTFDRLKQKKYGSFHFLEILATKNLRLGLFESVIWSSDSLSRSSFDINYLNPFVVFRPIEYNIGSPDNMLIGFNGSWDITRSINVYSQVLLDEFHSKNLLSNPTWWANKYGYQAGVKFHNFSHIPNLVFVLEHNSVRPFTYSHKSSALNYGHNYESLAHPYGANFREYLSIVNYKYKRFNGNLKFAFLEGGAEITDSIASGADIFKSYSDRDSENGYKIGHGQSYNQLLIEAKLSYIINYNYLLMAELGGAYRTQKLSGADWKEHVIFFGLKTSLFNLYYDY